MQAAVVHVISRVLIPAPFSCWTRKGPFRTLSQELSVPRTGASAFGPTSPPPQRPTPTPLTPPPRPPLPPAPAKSPVMTSVRRRQSQRRHLLASPPPPAGAASARAGKAFPALVVSPAGLAAAAPAVVFLHGMNCAADLYRRCAARCPVGASPAAKLPSDRCGLKMAESGALAGSSLTVRLASISPSASPPLISAATQHAGLRRIPRVSRRGTAVWDGCGVSVRLLRFIGESCPPPPQTRS